MNICKSDDFIADAELQYQWYVERAGFDVADRYLAAIASTCALLERQPLLGPAAALTHPRLARWRFFVVVRPFQRHVLHSERLLFFRQDFEPPRRQDAKSELRHYVSWRLGVLAVQSFWLRLAALGSFMK